MNTKLIRYLENAEDALFQASYVADSEMLSNILCAIDIVQQMLDELTEKP